MIIVKLQGGLGNQLFQFAIGKRLSIYYNTILKLDTSFLIKSTVNTIANVTPRQYALQHIAKDTAIATKKEIDLFSNNTNIKHRLKKYIAQYKYIKEANFKFDDTFLTYGKNCYLDGFWQSELYFKDIATDLKTVFDEQALQDDKCITVYNSITNCNAISIHIRRGDYVTNTAANKFHGVCSIEYYYKAIELIAAKVSNPNFFIFSDDYKWVYDNFNINHPFTIVDINNINKPLLDMKLMSYCKHHIIANSSFSWWGAWFNLSNEKQVIAPKNWFQDKTIDTTTLFPSNWITL